MDLRGANADVHDVMRCLFRPTFMTTFPCMCKVEISLPNTATDGHVKYSTIQKIATCLSRFSSVWTEGLSE